MSNNQIENAILEYRVDQLEKSQEKMVETAEKMGDNVIENNKESALQKQRLYILVVILVFVLNTGIELGKGLFQEEYSEKDKKGYYEKRIHDSSIIKKLEERINELEGGH